MEENELQIVEYADQRVVTTGQIADAYGTSTKNVTYNFRNNKERFQEGKHYFILSGEEKKDFINRNEIPSGSKKAKNIYLWTEKGALLLAKSVNTDVAWDAYDRLVDFYFEKKENTAVSVAGNTDMQTLMQGIERLIAQTNEENNRKITELENEIAELKSSKYVKLDFDLTPTWYDDNEERLFYLSEISGKPVKYFVHDILEFLAKFGFSKAKRWYIKNYGKPTYDLEILDCVPELSEAATCYIFELIRWEEVKAGIRGVKKYPTREEIEERERKWDEYFKS